MKRTRILPISSGLGIKLLLAFLLVALIGVAIVVLLTGGQAAREVRGAMLHGGPGSVQTRLQELAAYYQGRGEWTGVEEILNVGMRRGMGAGQPGMGPPLQSFILVDADGTIVASDPPQSRSALDREELSAAMPIQVGDETVGYLLSSEASMPANDQESLDRLQRAYWLGGAVAIAAALLVAGALAHQLLRPIHELTSAAAALASGELARRVHVSGSDEIGELSRAFNRMAENLEHAEKQRQALTADIAHELRNPLAVMQARLEALMDKIYPLTIEHLEPILDQSRLLNRLIEDLRTLAQADAGVLALERRAVDLRPLCEQIARAYQAQAAGDGVALEVDLPADEPAVAVVDPERITQVLSNLISNALRHTPEGGQVIVRLEKDSAQEMLRLQVLDSGEGIPEDELERVFDRFYRIDRSRAREAGGSGLGLAIARKLIQAHGGTIRAYNRPQGGACFEITLRCAEAHES